MDLDNKEEKDLYTDKSNIDIRRGKKKMNSNVYDPGVLDPTI
jgi:hypothetical protein